MGTELAKQVIKMNIQLIRDIGASGVIEFLSAKRAGHSDVANAMMTMGLREGRELMAELPAVTQVNLLQACSGAGEAPLVVFVEPALAPTLVLADSLMCSHRTKGVSWSEALALQLGATEAAEDVERDRERRTVEVTMPDGTKRALPVELDPNQALAYLSSILAMEDEGSRDVILEGLGPEFLAFVMNAVREGELDIDHDDFADALEDACTEDLYENARYLLEYGRSAIEDDLLVSHVRELERLYGVAIKTELEGEGRSAETLEDEIKM